MYTKEPLYNCDHTAPFLYKTHKSNIIIITSAMSLAPSAIEEGFAFHVPLVAYFPSSAVTPLLLMMVRRTAEKLRDRYTATLNHSISYSTL